MEEKKAVPVINTTAPTKTPEPVKPAEEKVEIEDTQKNDDGRGVDIDSLIPKEDYRTSPLWYEVVSFLGLPQSEYESAKNEISTIVDYVIREIKDNDIDKILVKIREIEDTIQKPEWGTQRYKNLYRYIRLASKKQSIGEAMKAFEKNGK